MAVASITSLGIGSGLQLQDILDSLREVDEAPITAMEEEKSELEVRLAEFDVVKAKLLTMKSRALALSLGSNYIERNISVSDTDVLTATVLTGTNEATHSVEVERLATNSSWQSAGVAGEDTSIYVPTVRESTKGFANTTTAVITANETMTIKYGSGTQETIEVTLTEDMTLDEVVTAIDNADTENYVTAETFQGDDEKYYLRIKATSGGSGEANRVTVNEPNSDLGDFTTPSTTFAYSLGVGSDPITITVAADINLSGLADLINDDENNPGVTASVADTGIGETPYRLVLTADESGEDNRITIDTQLADLTLTEAQGAGYAQTSDNAVELPITIIEGTNDKIDFKEDKGSGLSTTLTATITAGTYTTVEELNSLAADIESAMEAVSVNNIDYVVSYNDSTQKFVIEEAGTLEELRMLWNTSNAASTLGFAANEVILTPWDSSLNTEIEVNGITYQRQTNTGIDNILQGVTLNLSKTGTASLTVSANTQSIQADIEGLVDSLNDVIQEIAANETYDEDTEEWGTLAQTASIRGLDDELNSLMSTTVATGGSVTSLFDLGFEINRDGTVSLDEEVFAQAFSSHFEDITTLFSGDEDAGVTGLGETLNDKLRDLTKSTGLIENEKDTVEAQIDQLDDDIEADTERLDRRYETLTRQFIMLDTYMSRMQSQSAYLSAIFDSFDANKK